jgi:hypothetical protein
MEKKNGSFDPCIFPCEYPILRPTRAETMPHEKEGFQVRKQPSSIIILILFIILLLAFSPLIWLQISAAFIHP